METKIQILTRCEACGGEAYIQAGEATSYTGERYSRYEPCTSCNGAGRQTRWVSLEEFAQFLEEAVANTRHSDWLAMSQLQPTSQYADKRKTVA